MTKVSAKVVKDLREKTGAGMMDCKKALTENNGDMTQAIAWNNLLLNSVKISKSVVLFALD